LVDAILLEGESLQVIKSTHPSSNWVIIQSMDHQPTLLMAVTRFFTPPPVAGGQIKTKRLHNGH
jgi:hypothetical protein